MSLDTLQVRVFKCVFDLHFRDAFLVVKFLCEVFLEWKETSRSKNSITTDRVKVVDSAASFNTTMRIESEVIFVEENGQFLKRETSLVLNLISANRPDLVKLIGRIVLDLAEVLNENPYQEVKKHRFLQSPMKSVEIEFDRASGCRWLACQACLATFWSRGCSWMASTERSECWLTSRWAAVDGA